MAKSKPKLQTEFGHSRHGRHVKPAPRLDWSGIVRTFLKRSSLDPNGANAGSHAYPRTGKSEKPGKNTHGSSLVWGTTGVCDWPDPVQHSNLDWASQTEARSSPE